MEKEEKKGFLKEEKFSTSSESLERKTRTDKNALTFKVVTGLQAEFEALLRSIKYNNMNKTKTLQDRDVGSEVLEVFRVSFSHSARQFEPRQKFFKGPPSCQSL